MVNRGNRGFSLETEVFPWHYYLSNRGFSLATEVFPWKPRLFLGITLATKIFPWQQLVFSGVTLATLGFFGYYLTNRGFSSATVIFPWQTKFCAINTSTTTGFSLATGVCPLQPVFFLAIEVFKNK